MKKLGASMEAISRASTWISKVCQLVGGLSLLVIVLFTMTDVITRYLFKLTEGGIGFTVKGSVEVVSYGMLFALLSAFAGFVERSQIVVDVFTQKMPRRLKAYFMAIFLLVFCVVGGIMTWGLYDNMQDAIKHGNVTQDLRLPMSPIYGFSAILCACLSLRAFLESLMIFKTGEYYDAEEAA